MAESALRLEMTPDGVAVVIFDVPGEGQNTLKPTFNSDFDQMVTTLEQQSGLRGVVLLSGKESSFIVGADVGMLEKITTASQAEETSRLGHRALDRWRNLRVPTVAAIHGPCLGGGLEVALACTTRIASDDAKTALGLPEVQLGLIPGAGGTQRLPRLIGIQNALDLILTGKHARAAKAKKLGLVEEVVPPSILRQAAIELALKHANGQGQKPRHFELSQLKNRQDVQRLALEETALGRSLLFKKARETVLKKTKGNYPAPLKALDAVEVGYSHDEAAGYAAEAKHFGELVVSPEAKNLISIFFATTALKKDTGVTDKNIKARPVEQISVFGGGLMGSGIAYVATANGIMARIKEKDDESVLRALSSVKKLFDERVKKKQLTPIQAGPQFARLSATTNWTGTQHADMAIEAVFEDIELKQATLREFETHNDHAIWATNTSSIPISKIAEASKHPENVVGMHFFSPVNKMPLLEVVRGQKTSDEAVATAVAVGKKMQKTVIVVKDSVGFYTTRVLGPYTNEAAHLLAGGVPIQQIDRALVNFGWPIGPLALMDEVGIDVGAKVGRIVYQAFGERMAPPPSFEKLIEEGRSGRKNKKGFYIYGDGKKKEPDPSVYFTLGVTPKPGSVSDQEIAERCTLMFVNEAAYAFGDGLLRSPRDGDIGAIFGVGFPPFLGGPFRWVDTLGAAEVVKRLEHYQKAVGARFTPAPTLVEMAKSGKKFYGDK